MNNSIKRRREGELSYYPLGDPDLINPYLNEYKHAFEAKSNAAYWLEGWRKAEKRNDYYEEKEPTLEERITDLELRVDSLMGATP